MQGSPDIQCNMDRILYFRLKKNKFISGSPRLQVFCTRAVGKEIFYLQVCGYPDAEELELLQEEMCKAVNRLASRQRRMGTEQTSYLMYEDGFEKWLVSLQKEDTWRKMWKLPVYSDYYNVDNLKWMLEAIPQDAAFVNALILGSGIGMQDWLPLIAPRVRSITFYLEVITGSFEILREQLCEEYGLITQVHLMAPGELRKQKLRYTEPVLVIDFSGKNPISVLGLAKGSIWLDMDSVEAKRHAIEDRRTGVNYLSLKNLIQREMSETLDTISNF